MADVALYICKEEDPIVKEETKVLDNDTNVLYK